MPPSFLSSFSRLLLGVSYQVCFSFLLQRAETSVSPGQGHTDTESQSGHHRVPCVRLSGPRGQKSGASSCCFCPPVSTFNGTHASAVHGPRTTKPAVRPVVGGGASPLAFPTSGAHRMGELKWFCQTSGQKLGGICRSWGEEREREGGGERRRKPDKAFDNKRYLYSPHWPLAWEILVLSKNIVVQTRAHFLILGSPRPATWVCANSAQPAAGSWGKHQQCL